MLLKKYSPVRDLFEQLNRKKLESIVFNYRRNTKRQFTWATHYPKKIKIQKNSKKQKKVEIAKNDGASAPMLLWLEDVYNACVVTLNDVSPLPLDWMLNLVQPLLTSGTTKNFPHFSAISQTQVLATPLL